MTDATRIRHGFKGAIAAFQRVESRWLVSVPLMAWRAVCGFPSPADDFSTARSISTSC